MPIRTLNEEICTEQDNRISLEHRNSALFRFDRFYGAEAQEKKDYFLFTEMPIDFDRLSVQENKECNRLSHAVW